MQANRAPGMPRVNKTIEHRDRGALKQGIYSRVDRLTDLIAFSGLPASPLNTVRYGGENLAFPVLVNPAALDHYETL